MKTKVKKSRTHSRVRSTRKGAKSRYTKESKSMFEKSMTADKAATAKTDADAEKAKAAKAASDKVAADKAAADKASRRAASAADRAAAPTGLADPVVVHRAAVEWLCCDLPLTCTELIESGTPEDGTVHAVFTATFPSKFLMRGRLNRDANYLVDIRKAPQA